MAEIKPEFNLIDEPWIRVMDNECRISEVSLADVIINAHKYKALSGELPTQDIAVMRLILAVLHTVFSRVDENGDEYDYDDEEDFDEEWAKEIWNALWKRKSFSEKAITEYFEKWHERFWLFHPERPFYQVAGMKNGSSYLSPKLNGAISESGNKVRLFSSYSGNEKNKLTFSQAARWLLYLNGFDDNNVAKHRNPEISKDDKTNIKKAGLGYLGKLGLIYLLGDNLFETLMLNLVMISNEKVQSNQNPVWENETVSSKENNEISPIPTNMAQLYTLQSRRILLEREEGYVKGFSIYGGDFFDTSNYYYEPMTTWYKNKKNTTKDEYFPRQHDQSKQMWREFSVLYIDDDDNRQAEIINWYVNTVCGKIWKKAMFMKTAIASVKYDPKQCSVESVMSDSLEMHASILEQKIKGDWRESVETEIKKCEELASAIWIFGKNLYIASGGSDNDGSDAGNTAKEQLYYRLDIPFRKWLRSIDADESDREERLKVWRDTAKNIAVGYAKELAAQCSETAVVGHFVQGTEKKKSAMYSVPKAMNIFSGSVKKIYKKEMK